MIFILMIFILNFNNFNKESILVGEKENNLINYYNFFYKLNYITDNYTLYGLNISLDIQNIKQSVFYNYIKLSFNVNQNKDLILMLKDIEQYILTKINKINKDILYNDIKRGIIKLQKNDNSTMEHIVLRIIGVWEDATHCGLSYKFIYL